MNEQKSHEDVNFPEINSLLHKIQYGLFCCLGKTIDLLGFNATYKIADGFAFLAWHMLQKRQKHTIKSIQEHLHLPAEQAQKLAYESFRSTFRSFAEIGLTQKFGLESTELHFAEPELWDKFRKCRRPIVAATGHYGSWELLASLLGQVYQDPRPRMVVVRKYPNPAVHAFISKQREAKSAKMIGHRAAATAVLRALRKNGIVAFLVDHKTKPNEAYFLPFLGDNASINIGPALLAIRSNALIWPIFLERQEKGYMLHLQEPLDTALLEGTSEEKIRQAAEFYTKAMEKQILHNPEQWFWMHNRWNKNWND